MIVGFPTAQLSQSGKKGKHLEDIIEEGVDVLHKSIRLLRGAFRGGRQATALDAHAAQLAQRQGVCKVRPGRSHRHLHMQIAHAMLSVPALL